MPSCWRSKWGTPPWDTETLFQYFTFFFTPFFFFGGFFRASGDLPFFSALSLETGLGLFMGLNFLLFAIINHCVAICAREVRKNELWKQRSIYFYFLILFCALGITGCLWYFLGECVSIHCLFTGWYWSYGNSYHVFSVVIDLEACRNELDFFVLVTGNKASASQENNFLSHFSRDQRQKQRST